MLWEWRNEAATRGASYSTGLIRYEDHLRWFGMRLEDANTRILIALDAEDRPIGYARLDINGNQAEISLSLDRAFRGRGLGKALVETATRFAVKEVGIVSVIAYVKQDNETSQSAFERAGFVRMATLKVAGVDSVRMVYRDPGPHSSEGD